MLFVAGPPLGVGPNARTSQKAGGLHGFGLDTRDCVRVQAAGGLSGEVGLPAISVDEVA